MRTRVSYKVILAALAAVMLIFCAVGAGDGERGAVLGLESGSLELREGEAVPTDGGPKLYVELRDLTFANVLTPEGFELSNLPTGVAVANVIRESDTRCVLLLSGTPSEGLNPVRLGLTVRASQFSGEGVGDVTAESALTVRVEPAASDIDEPGGGDEDAPAQNNSGGGWKKFLYVAAGVLIFAAAAFAALVILMKTTPKGKKRVTAGSAPEENLEEDMPAGENENAAPLESVEDTASVSSLTIGKFRNIGGRKSQQDSIGAYPLDGGAGVLAVVADGMGGLTGGDEVSRGIVMSMLRQAGRLRPEHMDGVLPAMIGAVNGEINREIGPEGIYRRGSTVVAALVRNGAFNWVSVGDSRIYLYRGGGVIQLNQEHTYGAELMRRVINGEMSASEAATDPHRGSLTSFIGMGKLKYVDASARRIALEPGDRLLLMTDGVFSGLSDVDIGRVIAASGDARQCAEALERAVLELRDPAQDNFSAIIIGYEG